MDPLKNESYSTTHFQPIRLSAFVDRYTLYHFHSTEPVWLNPEGRIEMILQPNGGCKQADVHTRQWQSRPQNFVGGLHSASYYLKPESVGTQIISVQFKPHSARYFIPDKLHLFKNNVVDMTDVFSSSALEVLANGNHTEEPYTWFTSLETFLIGIFRKRSDSPINNALSTIFSHQGLADISRLANRSFMSVSNFRKRFNEEVGMSPKEYSKIIRINFAMRYLRQNPSNSLTALSNQLGFFDQAHFIRDFRSVVGMPPGQFIKRGPI